MSFVKHSFERLNRAKKHRPALDNHNPVGWAEKPSRGDMVWSAVGFSAQPTVGC